MKRGVLASLRATRLDAGVVIATALAALVISVEFCIVIGVFLSFVLYMPRAAQIRLVEFTRTSALDRFHPIDDRVSGMPRASVIQ